MPASRAAPFLTMSEAICTWRDSLCMSGASRASISTLGSILRASASSRAFSRKAPRFSRPRMKTGTEALYMEKDMSFPCV